MPAVQPLNSSDPVYAILPGYAASYAPAAAAQDSGYTPTVAGEQITVGSQIPGLAAGTYTLLPADYALLPGGFRVELTSGTLPAGTLENLGNFVTAAPAVIGNRGDGDPEPGAGRGPCSPMAPASASSRQYDEESYNDFETTAGTGFGTPRPFLPQDAKTLLLNYPIQIGIGAALAFDPAALLKAPASGGYGMTLEINTTNPIEITGAGAAPLASPSGSMTSASGTTSGSIATPTSLALNAGVLSALDVPRLLLGGTFTLDGNQVFLTGNAPSVTIDPNVVLRAGEVLAVVTSSGSITVSAGATVSSIGEGSTAFDLTQGFYFNSLVSGRHRGPSARRFERADRLHAQHRRGDRRIHRGWRRRGPAVLRQPRFRGAKRHQRGDRPGAAWRPHP